MVKRKKSASEILMIKNNNLMLRIDRTLQKNRKLMLKLNKKRKGGRK